MGLVARHPDQRQVLLLLVQACYLILYLLLVFYSGISEIAEEGVELVHITILHGRIEGLQFLDRLAVVVEIEANGSYKGCNGNGDDEGNIPFG